MVRRREIPSRSWWDDWFGWLKPQLGAQVAARELGAGPGKVRRKLIEAAPGSYARLRADPR
jgi:poly(3-hydroxyalkanoate) synthetase